MTTTASLKLQQEQHRTKRSGSEPAKRNEMPIKMNGAPSYLNLLDALNAWQLVKELKQSTGFPAAGSFKHVTPVGVAIGAVSLTPSEAKQCMVDDMGTLTPLATAYARARGADKVAAIGDFISLSDECDVATAKIILREASDGVIAPGYGTGALEVLSKKKHGNYCVLQIDTTYEPSEEEQRTVFGLKLKQKANDVKINGDLFKNNIVSESKTLPDTAVMDCIVATVTLKYSPSCSMCFAKKGQIIGIGAGLQSRLQCTKIAVEKAKTWWLRHHDRALKLSFVPSIKRADRATAIDLFLQDAVGLEISEAEFKAMFSTKPTYLTQEEKDAWLVKLADVVMGSDSFFPDRENVDKAKQAGAKFVVSPGGSTNDSKIVEACNEHGITLIHTGLNLAHH